MHKNTILYTSLALIAFAANSVLCRMALGEQSIDAAGFTIIRLLSGAIILGLILLMTHKPNNKHSNGSWSASLMLFIYALCFSFAYISLDTGTGALILFGSVQFTMITISLFSGTRLHYSEWLGLTIAFFGFVFLVLPGISTPSGTGFILMTLSGIAWGIYTLKGKGSNSPLSDTSYNFIRTLPLLLILLSISYPMISLSSKGIILAILSGALASGIGYSIWYLALALLTSTQAAVVQLSVPIIAAFGGVFWMQEPITERLMLSSTLILGGILLVVLGRKYLLRKGT
ncbi:MAG: DMT family transporter [Gammaproteobacteria bacterium]|nr:DMT family transporter [Gammaproteobacteria bacterium]